MQCNIRQGNPQKSREGINTLDPGPIGPHSCTQEYASILVLSKRPFDELRHPCSMAFNFTLDSCAMAARRLFNPAVLLTALPVVRLV